MKLTYIVVVALLSSLLSCSSDSTISVAGGGDDFPNSFQAMGKQIADNLSYRWENPQTGSEKYLQADASLQLRYDAGMGKHTSNDAVSCDSFAFFPKNGFWYYYKRSCLDSLIQIDSIVLKLNENDTALVYLANSTEFTGAVPRKIFTCYLDADGDSLLINSGSARSIAEKVSGTIFSDGRIERYRLFVDAGADRSFFTGLDNKIVGISLENINNNDTILLIRISDADGDGATVDMSSNDPGMVDISLQTKTVMGGNVVKSSLYTRYVAFPYDSSRNYPIRYFYTDSTNSGSVHQYVRGIHGDSTFNPGDTVDLYKVKKWVASDSLDCDTFLVRTVLGNNPASSLDDGVNAMLIHRTYKKGINSSFVFSFYSDTLLIKGQSPISGTIYLEALRSDGSWANVEGRVTGDGIEATVSVSSGKHYSVVWDINGKLLSAEDAGISRWGNPRPWSAH